MEQIPLPDGRAHIELQASVRFIEDSLNKYLTCEHPLDPETREPVTSASYAIHDSVLLDTDAANTILIRTMMGIYDHTHHLYLVGAAISPLLTLRMSFDGYLLTITKDSFETPAAWSDAQSQEAEARVDQLLAELGETVLPSELAGVPVSRYLIKKTDDRVLLGIEIAALTFVDETLFRSMNQGPCHGTDNLWGAAVAQYVVKQVLIENLHGPLARDVDFDRLSNSAIDIGDHRIDLRGSGNYAYMSDCDVGFSYDFTVHFDPEPDGEYLTGHLDASADPSSWDVFVCELSDFDVSDIFTAPFLIGIMSRPFLYAIVDAFVDWYVNSYVLDAEASFGNFEGAAVEIDEEGCFRVALTRVLGAQGGMLWPMMPTSLSFADGCITLLGDQGERPQDVPDDHLHQARLLTADIAVRNYCGQMKARIDPDTGESKATRSSIRLQCDSTEGLLGLCSWQIEEYADSQFTEAFRVVTDGFQGPALVMPGSQLVLTIEFGPSVRVAGGYYMPVGSYLPGTEFTARLKVTWRQANAQIGAYSLAGCVEYIELRGYVPASYTAVPGYFYDGSMWRIPDDGQWIELLVVETGRLLDGQLWVDVPKPEPSPHDFVMLGVSSNDPALETLRLIDQQGNTMASAGGVLSKHISVMVEAGQAYTVEVDATEAAKRSYFYAREVFHAYQGRIAFEEGVNDFVVHGNVLAVAAGTRVVFYDVGDPTDVIEIGAYDFGVEVSRLQRTREDDGLAVVAVSRNRTRVLAAPDSESDRLRVLQDLRYAATVFSDAALHAGVLTLASNTGAVLLGGDKRLSRITKKSWKTPAQQVVVGSGWIAVAAEPTLQVYSAGLETRKPLSELRHMPEATAMTVRGTRLYLHEKTGGTLVISLCDPREPVLVARYENPHPGRHLVTSLDRAFRLGAHGKGIDLYRTRARVVNRDYLASLRYKHLEPALYRGGG